MTLTGEVIFHIYRYFAIWDKETADPHITRYTIHILGAVEHHITHRVSSQGEESFSW